MKITIRVLAAAAMLAAASSPAFAQGGGGGGNMQERQAAQRAMLFEGITLSDEQKTKIDSISAAATRERMEARASMGEDRQAMMQKNMEIMTKERDAIKKVLTPEQVTQFEANIAKMPQMGRGRGGR